MANMHRWVAPAILLAGFLSLAGVYRGLPHETYMSLVGLLVDNAAPVPFIDTQVFLAWAECHGRGIDVLVSNPCDMLGRTLAQSPAWLLLSHVGANVGWTHVVGFLLDLLCLASFFWLPSPPDMRAAGIVAAAMWSPPVAFALERGNTDVLMFFCVVLALRLSQGAATARNWGYATIWFAGLLKFYPLAALAIALKEPPRRFWRVTALSVGAALVFVLVYRSDLPRIAIQTNNWFGLTFGAINLIAVLKSLAPGWDMWRGAILLCCTAPGASTAVAMLRRRQVPAVLNGLPPLELAFLVAGAALVVGSFVASMNGAYRAMFLVLTTAPLLRLTTSVEGRLFKAALGVSLFLLWWFKLHLLVIDAAPAVGTFVAATIGEDVAALVTSILILSSWLANQMAWWWFATVMLVLLAIFARHSPVGTALLGEAPGKHCVADGR